MTRREFIRRETMALGRFLDVQDLVGWRRSYRCECGYRTTDPGGLWDHVATTTPPQLPLLPPSTILAVPGDTPLTLG
jgi:hypothetical protein